MTTTKKTATAAAKAAPKPAPEASYERTPGPRPPVMSAHLGLKHDPPRISPPNRGPMTGEASMTDAQFVAAFSTPEELARLRREINERRAKDATTWAFFRCDRCGLVMKDKPGSPDGDPCPKCNRMRRQDGGHLSKMTQAEADQHLFDEAVREKAALERDRRAQFNRTNTRRGEQGLPPLSYEEFTRLQKAEFEQLKQRGRDLGQVAAAYRRKP